MNDVNNWFSNQGLVALSSALLGAVVGSLTGYIFNSKLEKKKAKERYWIQRKNTIYSPIYKELLALKEYLETVQADNRPFVEVGLEEDERHRRFNFFIWESIKKDVRYDYVPNGLKRKLRTLTKLIRGQEELKNNLYKEWRKIVNTFYERNKDKFEAKDVDVPGSLMNAVDSRFFPYSHNSGNNPITHFLVQYLGETYKEQAERKTTNLERLLKNVTEFKILKGDLQKLIKHTELTIKSFRELITKIIASYEGGVEL